MPAYKKKYTFEAEYLEADEQGQRRRETIEIPYITSDEFFDIIKDPAKDGMDNLTFARWLTERMFPGLIATLAPRSALNLMQLILEREKDTFNLGEATEPTPESGLTATG